MELQGQGKTVFRRLFALALVMVDMVGVVGVAGVAGVVALAAAADPPITPVTVCEITADLAAHEGKDVAVLGRYSFRRDGRWMGEEPCEPAGKVAPILWLTEDSATAPKTPGDFQLDAVSLNKKFADLLRRTALGKFRFGNPEYDRWAVVYGRVVVRKGDAARKAPADLVFRGNGVVIFLTTDR